MNETGNETVMDAGVSPVNGTDAQPQADAQPANAGTLVNSNQSPVNTDWTIDPNMFGDLDIEPAFVDGYSGLAKKYGMDQEKATAMLKEAVDIANKLDIEGVSRQTQEWQAQARNDKEFGGSALDANLSIAKKALDTYGTPQIRELLEVTGMGNNPEMIRFFYRVGKTLTEDGVVSGQTGGNGIKTFDDAARKLYGNP